ncbi:hypothetical protein [Fodinibius salsisoli]|uniref:Lipoprotein n=1 Tax=Fodinibius salsisoli TaxID=2820877 RepID=A0ABT3PJ72_9BACT|nr:hypothetical protein [Fodinibius salsisoli]MCW9705803.1 hypothetical protein [Fodinibius salsisoli]
MNKFFPLLLLLTIFISCSNVDFLRYTDQTFEPTKEVKVFQTNPPEKDYMELGLLSAEAGNDAIVDLKNKAKEIGANAIIILGERNKGTVAMPVGDMAYGVPINELEAVAIRYKNNQ